MQQHWKFLEIQNGLKEEIFEELKQFNLSNSGQYKAGNSICAQGS